MTRKTKKVTNRNGKSRKNRASTTTIDPTRNKCGHCGGLLKFQPDDASCLMCGRPADHHCANCINDNSGVAA